VANQGFCDASGDAYAAAVYCVSVDPDGRAKSSLICSKTRVAPLVSKQFFVSSCLEH